MIGGHGPSDPHDYAPDTIRNVNNTWVLAQVSAILFAWSIDNSCEKYRRYLCQYSKSITDTIGTSINTAILTTLYTKPAALSMADAQLPVMKNLLMTQVIVKRAIKNFVIMLTFVKWDEHYVTTRVDENISIKFLNKDDDVLVVDEINVRSWERVLTEADNDSNNRCSVLTNCIASGLHILVHT